MCKYITSCYNFIKLLLSINDNENAGSQKSFETNSNIFQGLVDGSTGDSGRFRRDLSHHQLHSLPILLLIRRLSSICSNL